MPPATLFTQWSRETGCLASYWLLGILQVSALFLTSLPSICRHSPCDPPSGEAGAGHGGRGREPSRGRGDAVTGEAGGCPGVVGLVCPGPAGSTTKHDLVKMYSVESSAV